MNKVAVARLVSIVGHPFTFVVLLLLLPYWKGGETDALRVTGFVVAVGLLPLGLFMWRRYTSGRWETVDASARANRPVLYFVLFTMLLLSSLYFLLVEKSPTLVRGSAVVAVMLGVATALNRLIKLSLHLAFAGFGGLILTNFHLAYGLPILLFIPPLAWSRLALIRHTVPEVIGGLALGLVSASVMLWL